MASLFLRPVLSPNFLGLGMGISLATFTAIKQRPVRLDSKSFLSTESYKNRAETPVIQNGRLSPGAVKQISSGSIIGLCAGLALSTFSRPLALILGLMIVGVQWAASHGIKLLPYDKLQRYVTSVNLRSALEDNIAFKLSFGMTFAMAAFMHF